MAPIYLGQEFGQVDIIDGFEEQDRFILVHVLELEVAGSSQHGLDGPHAVVVVVLRGQLL